MRGGKLTTAATTTQCLGKELRTELGATGVRTAVKGVTRLRAMLKKEQQKMFLQQLAYSHVKYIQRVQKCFFCAVFIGC